MNTADYDLGYKEGYQAGLRDAEKLKKIDLAVDIDPVKIIAILAVVAFLVYVFIFKV